jgi:solute:Na+ symporter, SSS family
MQRLNTARSARDAQRASMLFIVLQYLVRSWPWFIIGITALVLIPIGAEQGALDGAGGMVADDREMAYPVLMGYLLGPGILGLLVTSLLAAFMSTVDTHINWGASYMVTDVYLKARPDASDRSQVYVARLAVVGFVVLGVLVSFQIDTIEQAWRWVAALGAALGIPTALRWLWWRVNAWSEISAMTASFITSLVLIQSGYTITDLSRPTYGITMLITVLVTTAVWLGVTFATKPESDETLNRFYRRVRPAGPGRPPVAPRRR